MNHIITQGDCICVKFTTQGVRVIIILLLKETDYKSRCYSGTLTIMHVVIQKYPG